jgi:hypothetical protein
MASGLVGKWLLFKYGKGWRIYYQDDTRGRRFCGLGVYVAAGKGRK